MLSVGLETAVRTGALPYLTRNLGFFTPSVFTSQIIGAELSAFLKAKGIRHANDEGSHLPIAVRTPADHLEIALNNEDVKNPHRDGITPPQSKGTPSFQWMIVWSNRTPTQLQTENGMRLIFECGQVILFDNIRIRHWCPPPEVGRWFARLNDPILPESIWTF